MHTCDGSVRRDSIQAAEVGREKPGWLMGEADLFHRRAPGNTCLDALRATKSLGQPATNDSKGCGGVMRVAPVGLFAVALDGRAGHARAFEWGCSMSALTHGHPSGILPGGAFALLIAELASGGTLDRGLDAAEGLLKKQPSYEETLSALALARELAARRVEPDRAIDELGQGWVAEEALGIAVYCALVASSFEEGVIMAVNHDGDSDSTGSITGNLLGAAMGIDAIPDRWLEPLELRDVITTVADDLCGLPETAASDPELQRFGARYPGW